jgi:flagellar operon protein
MSMDVKKISGLDGGGLRPNSASNSNPLSGGPSFRETLSGLDKFSEKAQLSPTSNSALKFSNHAIDRMRSRGVTFTPDQMSKLESAVKKAAEKGGKDSLVLMNDTAVIVSVKNNTVVTVVDKASLKENVFTNIDSTIVI